MDHDNDQRSTSQIHSLSKHTTEDEFVSSRDRSDHQQAIEACLPVDEPSDLSKLNDSEKEKELEEDEEEEEEEEEAVAAAAERKKKKKEKKKERKKKKKEMQMKKKEEEDNKEEDEEEEKEDEEEDNKEKEEEKKMKDKKGKKKDEEEEKKKQEEDKKAEEAEEKKHFIYYNQLYKHIIHGNWENTKRAFDEDPSAINGPITSNNSTALHLAVRAGVSIQFIRNLVGLKSQADLETLDQGKNTALHCAGIVGYTEAARILVDKNPSLTKFRDLHSKTPLDRAVQYAHKDTILLLLPVTRIEEPSGFTGQNGALLLRDLITAEFYDIVIYLLKCYPDLAVQKDGDGFSALYRLALRPQSFFSRNQLNFLQRLLYKCICVEKVEFHHKEDVENPAVDPEYAPHELRRFYKKFKFLQYVHDTKVKNVQALQLTKMLCTETVKIKTLKEDKLFANPIVAAARLGIHELVWEIVNVFPDAIWSWDTNQRRIFHLAVLNRKEKVYNLIYQMSFQRHYMMSYTDKFGNTILHLAGMLGPSDRVSGAALQMQRELQWFKEVETVVQPSYRVRKNNDKKTPWEVFTEEHKDLVKQGEEWMKNTATSCTVVAALVITVVFAAAFTLPGGNDSNGYPIFLNKLSFLIFSVSNALALFASSTSVLMFLGILTSRYSEEDFLRALPMRLCIGLATLFLSIAFMLAAFSSALHLVLVHRLSWVAAPIIVLAGVPLTLFVFLQFPLLIAMISSTFGPSIFRQQRKELFF